MTGTDNFDQHGPLEKALVPHGLSVRGGLRFDADGPVLPDGRQTESLLLVGHVGSSLWPSFESYRKTRIGPDPLDQWSKQVIGPIARAFDCVALYPFDRPWWPFQQWIAASEGLMPSPLGILMHPEFGLWHGYRAALAFDRPVDVPPPLSRPHPCDACVDRPCMDCCPPDAVTDSRFDVARCRGFLATDEGQGRCMTTGCASRNACPVGQAYRYEPAHMQFLMRALDLSSS